jgi:hypothetical protein
MRHHNITYYFAYTVENSSKFHFYETTINTANGGEKEATIELIKAVPDIVDYLLIDESR